jgi:hypothetical protein
MSATSNTTTSNTTMAEKAAKDVAAERAKREAAEQAYARLLATRPECPKPRWVLKPEEKPVINPHNVRAWNVNTTPYVKPRRMDDKHRPYVTWPGGSQTFFNAGQAFAFAQEIEGQHLTQDTIGEDGKRSLPSERVTTVRVHVAQYRTRTKRDKKQPVEVFVGYRPHFPSGLACPTKEGAEREKANPVRLGEYEEILTITWLVVMDSGQTQRVERLRPHLSDAPDKEELEAWRKEVEAQGHRLVLRHHVGEAQDGRVNCTARLAICPLPAREGGDVVVERTARLKTGCTIPKDDPPRKLGGQIACKLSSAERMRWFSLIGGSKPL